MVRILALDISLNCTGWAVLDYDAGNVNLVSYGNIPNKKWQTHGKRLKVLRTRLIEVMTEYGADEIVKEEGFVGGKRETPGIFKAHGVSDELFSNFKIPEYGNRTVKLQVGGHGNAPKEVVDIGVRKMLGLGEEVIFKTDDESDAIAVGLTHLIKTGRFGKELKKGVKTW